MSILLNVWASMLHFELIYMKHSKIINLNKNQSTLYRKIRAVYSEEDQIPAIEKLAHSLRWSHFKSLKIFSELTKMGVIEKSSVGRHYKFLANPKDVICAK